MDSTDFSLALVFPLQTPFPQQPGNSLAFAEKVAQGASRWWTRPGVQIAWAMSFAGNHVPWSRDLLTSGVSMISFMVEGALHILCSVYPRFGPRLAIARVRRPSFGEVRMPT